jgi:tetratricopeptide (TPR) repeat protein
MLERDRTGALPVEVLDEAIGHLDHAVEVDPRSAIAYANLALALRLRAEAGVAAQGTAEWDYLPPGVQSDIEAAAATARAARQRAPTDAAISAVAGTVFESAGGMTQSQGFFEEAAVAYSRALSHDAGLVQSPFWATNEFRLSVRQFALDASTLTACEKGRVTAIYRGYPDDLSLLANDCRLLVERNPGDARARSDLAMILYALGRRDEALLQAEEAVRRVPDTPFARTALAVTLIPEGDLARVRQELMLGAYLGDPDAALLLTYTYEAPGPANPVPANLGLPSESKPAPPEVIELLQKALPNAAPMVFDHGLQRYLLGILYYRMRFLRESPASIFIPQEWIGFASPRALLIVEALDGR